MSVRSLAGALAWLCALSVMAAPDESVKEYPARYRNDVLRWVAPDSGAVLRRPPSDGTAATCHILDSVWASAALDALGLHEHAARALAVHRDTIRMVSGTDTPAGSLPREIRPTGRAASFRGNADPESAAWLLAACWRHGATLPEFERVAYFNPIWRELALATDYLAREPVVGGALSGALPPSSAPLDALRTHYLGLESSRRMAETLGKEEPGLWADRRGEIYSRIRFRTLNQTAEEETMEPWLDWWIASLPEATEDSGWDVVKREKMPPLTESAITDWVKDESPRRDALGCLLGVLAVGE